MSTPLILPNLPSAVPSKIIGLSSSGSPCQTTVTALLNENPESKEIRKNISKSVWYELAKSSIVQGGSGIVYLWRDWGTGGSLFAQIAFCLPHGNQAYSDDWKPRIVFAIGTRSALRLRLVKSADKTWRLDVCQTNSEPVSFKARLVFYNSVTPLSLDPATLADTDKSWEYSIADLS